MKKKIVQILGSIGLKRGGLTKSVYERLNVLSEDNDVNVIVASDQNNFDFVKSNLYKNKIINENIKIINPFEKIKSIENRVGGVVVPLAFDLYSNCQEVKETNRFSRFFYNGIYRGAIMKNADGLIIHAEEHDENNPFLVKMRDQYDSGKLTRRRYLNPDWSDSYSIFIDDRGKAYKSSWINSAGEYRTVFFDEKSPLMKTNFDFVCDYIKEEGFLDADVAICDEPTTIDFFTALNFKKKIAVIHTTHKDHHTGEYKSWWSKYSSKAGIVDKILVMNSKQRDELKNFFEDGKNILSNEIYTTFPCPADRNKIISEREKYSVAYIGRLSSEKQVDHIIRAIELVRGKIPEVKLKIYGVGPEEKKLRDLVSARKMESNIDFMGFTDNSRLAFSKVGVSVVSSKFEGFCLAILESLSVGTPVVAYDVDYGPREQIVPNNNGYLIKFSDIDGLANKIIDILQDQYYEKFISNAFDSTRKFSRDEWKNDVVRLFS